MITLFESDNIWINVHPSDIIGIYGSTLLTSPSLLTLVEFRVSYPCVHHGKVDINRTHTQFYARQTEEEIRQVIAEHQFKADLETIINGV